MTIGQSLKGRVAVVTGAANGLGASIARCLSTRGAQVAVTDIDEEGARNVAKDLPESSALSLDVGNPTMVQSVFSQIEGSFGCVDILVNNAGFQRVSPISDYLEEDWNSIVQTILTGTFLCTKRALPCLRESGHGTVVNIASVHGLVASPLKSAYVSAKHGVVGFTKALALEEAENNVTANAVCPGYVRTALAEAQIVSGAKERDTGYAAAESELLQPMSVKRLLEPDEVSELVAYLCSESARGITGSIIPIDGGWTAR